MIPSKLGFQYRLALAITLLAVLWPSHVESVGGRQYDQYCSETEACNTESGLSCQSNRCKCAPGGETVFSVASSRCVGSAGRECLRQGNETLCVENSICRDYNYMFLCACKDGFYQSQDGNCYKVAKYGEPCREEDYACGDSVTTSVSCVDRKCRCLLGEENQYFDTVENRCISYAGSQCLFHYQKPCSDNSYCGEIAENINGASFVVGHRCLCKIGYSYTRNRRCLARYGTSCSSQNPCNYDDAIGCLNGICQCRNSLNELYDEKSGQCRILVGSSCSPQSTQKCVRNAECGEQILTNGGGRANNATRVSHKCQCATGYSVTPMNTCLLDLNQKCQSGDPCNNYNALVCKNDTCACLDSSLTYDKTTKCCVSMIGQPCGYAQVYDNDQGMSGSSHDGKEIMVMCEANAVCAKTHHYSSSNGNGAVAKRVCTSKKG